MTDKSLQAHGRRLRWGILGTGNIARQFAEGVAASERTEIVAVGSRTDAAAGAFASAFGIGHASDYSGLIHNPHVDAVYVALPNSMHKEWTIRALEAGKHVLCEKPLAMNAQEGMEMFSVARRADRTLVEAYMYRTHPQTHAVLREIRAGSIGRLRLIRASFCFRVKNWSGNIRFDPTLGGGALMDIGCYCIDVARLLTASDPTSVVASGVRHESGVDEQVSAILAYPDARVAQFSCGMTLQADNSLQICGEDGFITVAVPWKPPVGDGSFTVNHGTPPRQEAGAGAVRPPSRTVAFSSTKPLYAAEADAFAAVVAGESEPFITPEDSLSNLRVMDAIREMIR
jgi:predicted dehydrogenase